MVPVLFPELGFSLVVVVVDLFTPPLILVGEASSVYPSVSESSLVLVLEVFLLFLFDLDADPPDEVVAAGVLCESGVLTAAGGGGGEVVSVVGLVAGDLSLLFLLLLLLLLLVACVGDGGGEGGGGGGGGAGAELVVITAGGGEGGAAGIV